MSCQGHDRATPNSPCQSTRPTLVMKDGRRVCMWHFREETGQIQELQDIDLAIANAEPPVEEQESTIQFAIRGAIEYAVKTYDLLGPDIADDDENAIEIEETIDKLRRLYFSFFLVDFGGSGENDI